MGKKKRLRKQKREEEKKASLDPWQRLMSNSQDGDGRAKAQRAEAWQLVVRRALRSRQGLSDFLEKIHAVPHLPKDPDVAFLKHLADACRLGTPLLLDQDFGGLSRPARIMLETLVDKSKSFSNEQVFKGLNTFAQAPAKIMPRHYQELAKASSDHSTFPKTLMTLADYLGKLRALNYKKSVEEGPNILGKSKHFQKIDNHVRVLAQSLPENLATVLLHPLRTQIFQATHRLAQHVTGTQLQPWFHAFGFLLGKTPGVDLEPILNLLSPSMPTKQHLLNLAKQIPGFSMEETAAHIPRLHGWAQQVLDDIFTIVTDGKPMELDPDLAELLGGTLTKAYEHLSRRLVEDLKGADLRERARCCALLESMLCEDIFFLDAGFHTTGDLSRFLNNILDLNASHPRLALMCGALSRAHGLSRYPGKVLEVLKKLEPLTADDATWCFDEVNYPLFHLKVLDMFLQAAHPEGAREYLRRIHRNIRETLHIKFLQKRDATEWDHLFRSESEQSASSEYFSEVRSQLATVDNEMAKNFLEFLDCFPDHVWHEAGYHQWIQILSEKKALREAVEKIFEDLEESLSEQQEYLFRLRPRLPVPCIHEFAILISWMAEHPEETIPQVLGTLERLVDKLLPFWEEPHTDLTPLIRLHNALQKWEGEKPKEIQAMARKIWALLRRAAQTKIPTTTAIPKRRRR